MASASTSSSIASSSSQSSYYMDKYINDFDFNDENIINNTTEPIASYYSLNSTL